MVDSGFRHPESDELRGSLVDGIADGWHAAVVSDPFAGRTALLDEAVSATDGTVGRIRLSAHVDDVPRFPDAETVVVENCQYLFGRRIGGFGTLGAVENLLAADDRQFVTGWNRYAWNYLAAVRDIDDLFPVEVSVPPLDAEGVGSVLSTDDVRFEATDETRSSGHEPDPGPTGPVPERVRSLARLTTVLDLFDGGNDDPRAASLDALARHSRGSLGAARALLDRATVDGVVTPHRVRDAAPALDVTDEEAFAAQVVLSNGRLARDQLRTVVGGRLFDRSLRQLRRQDIVTVGDGTVALRPEALAGTVDFLERRRLLW